MNLKERLTNDFAIDSVQQIQEIGKGISSHAKLIITSDLKYILRKVRDRNQAIAEYQISKVLRKHNISPEILLSKLNQPFIEINNEIYNVQTYIPNQHVESEMDYYNLGKVISLFHSEIQKIDGLFEQSDRFSLNEMWNQLKYNIDFVQVDFKRRLTNMVEQCLSYQHGNNYYIHGDLGKWNLLFNRLNTYIIDFGEVRRGNNHFDISAVISSTIDWNQNEEEMKESLMKFKAGYIENFRQFDWELLRENLALWYTRGIIALLVNNGINTSTSSTINILLERRDRLNHIIEDLPNKY